MCPSDFSELQMLPKVRHIKQARNQGGGGGLAFFCKNTPQGYFAAETAILIYL